MSELAAYAGLIGMDTDDDRDFFLSVMLMVDNDWMASRMEAARAEREAREAMESGKNANSQAAD